MWEIHILLIFGASVHFLFPTLGKPCSCCCFALLSLAIPIKYFMSARNEFVMPQIQWLFSSHSYWGPGSSRLRMLEWWVCSTQTLWEVTLGSLTDDRPTRCQQGANPWEMSKGTEVSSLHSASLPHWELKSDLLQTDQKGDYQYPRLWTGYKTHLAAN